MWTNLVKNRSCWMAFLNFATAKTSDRAQCLISWRRSSLVQAGSKSGGMLGVHRFHLIALGGSWLQLVKSGLTSLVAVVEQGQLGLTQTSSGGSRFIRALHPVPGRRRVTADQVRLYARRPPGSSAERHDSARPLAAHSAVPGRPTAAGGGHPVTAATGRDVRPSHARKTAERVSKPGAEFLVHPTVDDRIVTAVAHR